MDNLAVTHAQSWLAWFWRLVLVGSFLLLAARLIELQFIKGSYFRSLAEGNRIKRVVIPAPRGRILARGGEVLVDNLANVPQTRNYILGKDFAHASGYVSEVGAEEVGRVDPACPQKGAWLLGSIVGRVGIEEQYDCHLRGLAGEELVEVDTKGRKVRALGVRTPVPGEDIRTTIDFGLQKKVAESFPKGKKGAAVVTDPNGEVLAFYSAPSFDPEKVAGVLNDPGLPLFDRVIGGTYHPGSTFKIVTAVAGLEGGKIDKNYTYEDPGVIRVKDFAYSNWYFTQYGRTEGTIGLVRAIARSTDTFFYKLGEMVGVNALADWARKFGLGEPTGIDLPGEVAGLIPDPQWKEEAKGESWFLGNTYHMAIGQGDLALTPLAVNQITLAMANQGRLCQPHLVVGAQFSKGKCRDLSLHPETVQLIRQGMEGVCSAGGTAFPFFDWNADSDKPKVACKTGTAETYTKNVTHAWFTLFAPTDNPEVVMTVLVEEGGEGSATAAPIAREILNYWSLQRNP